MRNILREGGARAPSTSDLFFGQASSQVLNANLQYRVSEVAFAPGGRSRWHTHSFHQVLVITEGRGVVATEEERHVVPGDVVSIERGTRHWRGAGADAAVAHLSIGGAGDTRW